MLTPSAQRVSEKGQSALEDAPQCRVPRGKFIEGASKQDGCHRLIRIKWLPFRIWAARRERPDIKIHRFLLDQRIDGP